MGTDVKLAGDVDEPLFGLLEVSEANAPWAINNIDQVIYSCAAACPQRRFIITLKKQLRGYTMAYHLRLKQKPYKYVRSLPAWTSSSSAASTEVSSNIALHADHSNMAS